DGAHLYVGNGARLLIYDGVPESPTVRPPLLLGRPDLDSDVSGTTSSALHGEVAGVWSDGNRLLVASGSRVLVWQTLPSVSFRPADLVLGQTDFSSEGANPGGVSGATFNRPTAIDSDGTRVLVADTINNRVLVWDHFPSAIGEPATSVIGQPTL